MNERQNIQTENAPRAIGPYVQAVRIGNMIYTSGQIGINPASGEVEGRFVADQTRQVLENLKAVLTAGGASLKNVVKTTVFLLYMSDFSDMNEVYTEYFQENFPARSTVAVARLPKDALIEIEVIALVEEAHG